MEFILGGYTRRVNDGLYKINFNPFQGVFEERQLIDNIDNPTYFTLDPDNQFIFSIIAKDGQGGLIAYGKDGDSWVELNTLLFSPGPGCHVSYRPSSQTVYVSDYHNGRLDVINFEDHKTLSLLQTIEFEGSSIHANQKSSHIHYAACNRLDNNLYICDLGTDKVHSYHIEADGSLSPSSILEVPAGTGPRHLVVHPNEPYGYIIGELANTTIVVSIDMEGNLSIVDTVLNVPEDAVDSTSGAAIRISNDGKYLYTSNRGHNSITVFEVLNDGSSLKEIQNISSGGEIPRDFVIDPTQEYLLVAHQDSDYIVAFQRNSETGLIQQLDKKAYAPECVCIFPGE